MTYAEPPRPVDDPRPPVETLRKWPFVLMGIVAVTVLGAVTIGPSLLRGEPESRRIEPEPRTGPPRPLQGMPLDYTQVVQQPPPPVPEPVPPPAPEPAAQAPAAPAIGMEGMRPQGPTRAELLKAARMADLAAVPVAAAGTVEDTEPGGGPAASGSRLYSRHSLTDPFPCQVNAGVSIPAMTEQRITSESPGTVSAIVTRDIWSADKTCLAMPRGTRFVGRYQTAVAEGQARLGIVWTGLTRPPPRNDTIDLDDTVAGDPDGTAGLSGEVNGHFWRKLGYVAAASILDITKTAITASGEGGMGAAIAGIFANRATNPMDEWARRQLDIPPVIEVEPREITIVLARHVPLDEFRTRR
ncbi:TrbI/VirB10 family protein (plasmid) [Skermanella mucosa]|uniref:TrbI/VirB10 family protein n=1 Tax=Skermanella mucosa TaxID=1789672 RepID=UPI00192B30B2|nr:TrbI/VirB10 family protein [Skermanella mucosa]UEM24309.1 TrbI/VirB10 family protein [Skermanella mucosa]